MTPANEAFEALMPEPDHSLDNGTQHFYTADQMRQMFDAATERAAKLAWKDVRVDGLPPCDGETVYVGENEAGYMCCFNGVSDGDCWMGTPENNELLMSCLRFWRVQERPVRAPASLGSSGLGEGG